LPNDTWEPEFLYYWFVSSYQHLRNFSADRGGNQPALNGALLRALKVPAPEKKEQRHIVQQVKAALSEIEIMEQTSKQMLADIKQLPNRILAQAFES
jgi:type I restriction enzyme S subunit